MRNYDDNCKELGDMLVEFRETFEDTIPEAYLEKGFQLFNSYLGFDITNDDKLKTFACKVVGK